MRAGTSGLLAAADNIEEQVRERPELDVGRVFLIRPNPTHK